MPKRIRTLVKSFNSAYAGLMYTLATQRNMRLHLLLAVVALCLGIYLNLTILRMALLILVIGFVFVTEILNTVAEIAVGFLNDDRDELKQTIKNIAAAAVLIASITASLIGYLILIKPLLHMRVEDTIVRVTHSPWQATLLSLVIVLSVVTIKKLISLSKKKVIPSSLEGGMPSGHSAIAFSVWTVISLLSKDGFIISLALLLVILILQSRVKQTVHTIWETVVGGFIGVLVTVLIFQLLG